MTETSPAISVALSVYNGERYLKDAIASVCAQTFARFEFLILDDGSQDSSRTIIEAAAAHDSRIKPVFRENRGLVASLNQLLMLARAPLVARMDADDLCAADRLEKQFAYLNAHPEVGVLGTWTHDIDERGHPWAPAAPDHPVDHEGFLAAVACGAPLLCHPAVMYRRDLVLAVGGYHPAFRHCEDLDLWLRLADRTRIANLPERLLAYRHYPRQVSNRHAAAQQVGAAVARLAFAERRAGRDDPTATLESLPPLDQLDRLFARAGVARAVRAEVAPGLLYARSALAGDGLDIICAHLRDGGSRAGMGRTVLRMVGFGLPWRALRLAWHLLPFAGYRQRAARGT